MMLCTDRAGVVQPHVHRCNVPVGTPSRDSSSQAEGFSLHLGRLHLCSAAVGKVLTGLYPWEVKGHPQIKRLEEILLHPLLQKESITAQAATLPGHQLWARHLLFILPPCSPAAGSHFGAITRRSAPCCTTIKCTVSS